MKRIVAMLLLSASLPGCPEKKTTDAPATAKPVPVTYQRFVPIAPIPTSTFMDFALDTKTGQLCKTWKGQLLPINERTLDSIGLPLCIDLYAKDPDQSTGESEQTTREDKAKANEKGFIPDSIPRHE